MAAPFYKPPQSPFAKGWATPPAQINTPTPPKTAAPKVNLPAPGSPTINPGGVRQAAAPKPPAPSPFARGWTTTYPKTGNPGPVSTKPAATPSPFAPKGFGAGGGVAPPAPRPPAPAPAPPKPPAPPAPYAPTVVPADEAAKAAATATYGTDTAAAIAAIQQAAMAYGDPSIMGGWNLGSTVDPNSALAQAALKAQQDRQTATDARERAGTLFSSLAQRDFGTIANTQQQQQLAGYDAYQKALGDYNIASTRAAQARDAAINQANADEMQTTINNLPQPTTTGSGVAGPGTTSVTSKIPPSKTAPKGKTTTLKPPTKPSGKTTKPGSGKTSTTSNKPGKPSSVKQPAKKTAPKGKASVPASLIRVSQK
jgi:hypothetical protein